MNEKVKCEICGKEFEMIAPAHLRTHNLTTAEYHKMFPDAPFQSEKRKKQVSNTLKNKYESGELKIWSDGLTKETDERVKEMGEEVSKILKKEYNDGKRISWNKGETKETNNSVKQQSNALIGRTKENDESVRRMSETLTGRTKENHEGVRKQSEKMTGRTKENDEGTRRQTDALRGRTKEEYEYIQRQADKLTGRTKEEYDYLKRQSEKMKSRTGELAPQWKEGVSFEPYCPKFDDDLKERVRLFFDRKCYICGKSEQEQIDEMKKEGKVPIRKLDVHHVNYNKDTCCDDSKPLFVPLCRKCHMKTNQDKEYWEDFFTVSLNYLTDGECFTKK